jgi:hypothetical protein
MASGYPFGIIDLSLLVTLLASKRVTRSPKYKIPKGYPEALNLRYQKGNQKP